MTEQAKAITPRTSLPWSVNPECATTLKVGPTGEELKGIPIVGGKTQVVGYVLNGEDGKYIIEATQAVANMIEDLIVGVMDLGDFVPYAPDTEEEGAYRQALLDVLSLLQKVKIMTTDDRFTIYTPDGQPIFTGTAAEVMAFIMDKRDTSGAALNPGD